MSNENFVPVQPYSFNKADIFDIDLCEIQADDLTMYHPLIHLHLTVNRNDNSFITLDTEIFTDTPEEAIFAAYEVGMGLCDEYLDEVRVFDQSGEDTGDAYSVSDIIEEIYNEIESSQEQVPPGTVIH